MKLIKKQYFLIILFFLFTYTIVEIIRSSFVIQNIRYFSLFDDEMISMRYAYNLVSGNGLVWNAGERVEGITNPLWTLIMAVVHLLPIPLSKTALVIQLVNALLLLGNVYVIKKITDAASQHGFVAFSSVLLTAFYFPIIQWAVMGTEVTILMFIVSLSVYLSIKVSVRKFYLLIFILSASLLIRFEMIIPSIVILLFLFVTQHELRRHVLFGSLLLTSVGAGQTVFRYSYYGDFFPNTYYLKMTGFPFLYRITRGLFAAFQFVMGISWVVIIGIIGFCIFKRNKLVFLCLSLFFTMLLYSIYVGADAWEYFGGSNRFLTPVMPLFFTALSVSVYQAAVYFSKITKIKMRRIAPYLFTLPIIYLVSLHFATDEMFLEWSLIKQPQFIPANKVNVERALILEKITNENATIAIHWAGTAPYFVRRQFLDLLGKNDKVIARQKAHIDSQMPFWMKLTYFLPGHMKWDYAYSVGELQPDVIAERSLPDEAAVYLRNYQQVFIEGYVFYIKKNSKQVTLHKVKSSTDIPAWSAPYQRIQQ